MNEGSYVPLKPSRILRCQVRDADYLVRMWGPDTAPPILLLHGTRDTSITFQFLVDAFGHDWRIMCPDWRGHGRTIAVNSDAWFHDYLADLDILVKLCAPEGAHLVGHSLGGNLATVYAALRPERVRRVVSLDGFGVAELPDAAYIDSILGWLRRQAGEGPPQREFRSVEEMACKLQVTNPRLTRDKALYLAHNSSRAGPGGGLVWQIATRQRRSLPTLQTLSQWIDCWRRIKAPKLWIAASEPRAGSVRSDPQAFASVCDQIGRDCLKFLPDTGHNMHHDAPGQLAALLERFMLNIHDPM